MRIGRSVAQGQAVRRFGLEPADERASVARLDDVGLVTGSDLVIGHQHVEQDRLCWLIADAAQVRPEPAAGASEGVARRTGTVEYPFAAGRLSGQREDRAAQTLVDLHAVSGIGRGEEGPGALLNPGIAMIHEPAAA